MKIRGRKFFKLGKLKSMIAGGVSRKGDLYLYAGIKSKSGLSTGASIGTKGKQVYGSINKKGNQARVKSNLTTGNTSLRLKTRRRRR